METRPTWDQYWLRIAHDVASRGTCLRRKVGAVLVTKDNRILSTGYNGKASELPNCNGSIKDIKLATIYPNACSGAFSKSGTNLDGCQALHAEQNALLYCSDVRNIHTCYVTCSSCVSCLKMLLGTGCQRIVFAEEYPHQEARKMWEAAGREWVKLVDF